MLITTNLDMAIVNYLGVADSKNGEITRSDVEASLGLATKDEINAGTAGGMVAIDGGYARLDGGTINITKDNSRLFYADATGKIDFTKLIYGEYISIQIYFTLFLASSENLEKYSVKELSLLSSTISMIFLA